MFMVCQEESDIAVIKINKMNERYAKKRLIYRRLKQKPSYMY